ncbi:MAG: transporter related protein [Conexibacter sp.]|nr:transporter related protein [Conexibacter sp.]
MSEFFQLLLLGLGSGSLFALAALGLVLVYRSSGVVNFAHGAVGMVGSFIFWDLQQNGGWATVPAAVIAVALSAVLGLVTFVVTMVLPRGGSTLTRVITTLAVLIILQAVAELRYGQDPRIVDQFLPAGNVDFGGGVKVGVERFVLLGVAIVLSLVLSVIYQRTRFGIATTAVSENPRNLAALGWRIGFLRAGNWALGGALAGLAGVLISPIAGVSVGNGLLLMVSVLAAALIGGLASFGLTLAGGLFIGVSQAEFAQNDFGITGLADAVPFLVIIAVLLVRGRKLPLRSFVGERLPKVGSGHVPIGWVLVGCCAAAFAIGSVGDDGTSAITTTLVAAVVLLSLTVVLGYAGQLSLAQVTLSGVGAMVAAKLAKDAGLPFPLVLPLSAVATVPVGLLVGLPSVRTRGVSLAIATLGLAVAIQALIFNNNDLSGGQNGIPLSADGAFTIFGVEFDTLLHGDRFAFLALGTFVVLAVLVANLRRGRAGRRLVAVRSNERAAAALGIDVVGAKLWAFGIAAAIAGVGGVLIAYRNPAVLFDQFGVFQNISAVAFSVVGGAGSALGAVFGGTLQPAGVGSELLDAVGGGWSDYIDLVGGVLLLLTIIAAPDGLVAANAQTVRAMAARVPTAVRSLVARLPGSRRSIERHVADLALRGATAHIVPPAVLEVRDVRVSFGGVRAVDGVDLKVLPGEVVAVIGPNGAGKTTLIDAITGFVPSTGQIDLGGQDLGARSPHGRARAGLARSWQSLELFEDLSVLENLRTAGEPRDGRSYLVDLVWPTRGNPTPATLAAIRAFDLAPHLGAAPGTLSSGQRKLVAMARAIATEPSVLLLDEPCAGLDDHERQDVGPVIRSLVDTWGMGVLLVEHDVDLVRRISDRVVVLDFGKVIASGTPDEVLADEQVREAYLGTFVPESNERAVVEEQA